MGEAPASSEASQVVAALGPTNTGKTHRAIERMLEHESGMFGLPLRLLAREVYDRLTVRLGEERVALITGEEKRVPRRPSYWVCTTEAMPLDIPVEFLAIDEIQLATHHERGHVFTDRLLHARGTRETWFLGAATMRSVIDELLPRTTSERFRRLSRLRSAGVRSLRSVPPRSAVVAFSTNEVYALAERIRGRHGGVAVVLGTLSPRTRNAQVAMYQAGEVDFLVATDAIGMGLNLDIDHVVFASVRKFDGQRERVLTVDEIAQIAGRAGRHVNDGTFATLRPLPELDPRVIEAVETHRFAPVKELMWRSSALDFTSIESLLESLRQPSGNPLLRRVEETDDLRALSDLAVDTEVHAVTTSPDAVEILWEVCCIPDFRKLLLHRHRATLKELYLQLRTRDGRLDEGWLDRQIDHVDDVTGGIDQLTARLAAVRTWTYVSQRSEWLDRPHYYQERTRAIEDGLGDALHERLVERFVERARPPRRARSWKREASPQQDATKAGPFAELARLMVPASGEDDTEESFVERVVHSTEVDFALDRSGAIRYEGEFLARLVAGRDVLSPMIALADPDLFSAGSRRQLERRLLAFARDTVAVASGGFRATAFREASAEARGLVYELERGLGIVPLRGRTSASWSELPRAERDLLGQLGVRHGERLLYVEGAMDPLAFDRRATLVAVHAGQRPPPTIPSAPQLARADFGSDEVARAFGYEPAGPRVLRADVLERLLADLADRSRHPDAAARLDGLDLELSDRERALSSLGYVAEPPHHFRRRRSRRRRRPRRVANPTPKGPGSGNAVSGNSSSKNPAQKKKASE